MKRERPCSNGKLKRGDEITIDLNEREGGHFSLEVSYGDEKTVVETGLARKVHPLDDIELKQRVQNFERMNELIIGQKEMVQTVQDAVASHYFNEKRSKPLSLGLIGPTGIGKTETGKALAQAWFGNENRLEVIPLGGIQYEGQLNDIFGSPKGHVGSEDIGPFEQALRNNAQGGVIIFDEFSNMGMKGPSHKDMLLKYFYHIMDEGTWRSNATGQVYDLSPYIFIFTGNDGEKYFQNVHRDLQHRIWKDLKSREKSAKILLDSGVPQAFIGRLSDVILARPLDQEGIAQINKKFLAPMMKMLQERNIKVTMSEGLEKSLAETFFLPSKGARSTQHLINDVLWGEVNKFLLDYQGQNIEEITLDMTEEGKEKRKINFTIESTTEQGEVLKKTKDLSHKAADRANITPELAKQAATHEAGARLGGPYPRV